MTTTFEPIETDKRNKAQPQCEPERSEVYEKGAYATRSDLMQNKAQRHTQASALNVHSHEPKLENAFDEQIFMLVNAEDIHEVLPSLLAAYTQDLYTCLVGECPLPPRQNEQLVQVQFVLRRALSGETFIHHAHTEQNQDRNQIDSDLLRWLATRPNNTEIETNRQTDKVYGQYKAPNPSKEKASGLGEDFAVYCRLIYQQDDTQAHLVYHLKQAIKPSMLSKWACCYERKLELALTTWHQQQARINQALRAERALYAAQVHDSIAQVLGYLRIKSTQLDKLCEQTPYLGIKSFTEDLSVHIHQAYRQTRELITTSRLSMQGNSLGDSLKKAIAEFEQQSAIVFELDNRLQGNLLMPQQDIHLLYIVRESLSNIVRHSHAQHAYVGVYLEANNTLRLCIEDDGCGIDPSRARIDSFGLQIMHERAQRIGASLSIEARPEGGTICQLTLALDH